MADTTITTVYSCDLCPKAVFGSRSALVKHVELKHNAVAPDYDTLTSMIEKIRPLAGALLTSEDQNERWTAWGARAFAVTSIKDAGAERLDEACAAREQLELVVQRWRPNARVFIFGSSVAMSLWDGLSDIDFAVVDVDAMDRGEWPPNEKMAVRSLNHLLRSVGFSTNNLEPIEHARVPIIKHNASIPLYHFVKPDYERVIGRSVRFLFDRALSADERAIVEKSVDAPTTEHLWWDESSRVFGITHSTSTVAMASLLSPPTIEGARVMRTTPLHDEYRPDLFQIDFDLSFRTFGVRNSKLLAIYLNAHPCARTGALVLKDWSKSSGVNNSINGYLTSYAINILWIYYLIQRKHVPFVDPMSIPASLAGNTEFSPVYQPLLPPHLTAEARAQLHQQAGKMLLDFFLFYSVEFNWAEHVVSLNREAVTAKTELGWSEDDEVRLGGKPGRNVRYEMCIEDPYEENLNLGRHLGEARCRKVKSELFRGLVSLVKDNAAGGESCVFPKSDAAATPQEPPIDDVLAAMGVAIETIEGADAPVSTAALTAALEEQCPDAFKKLLEFMPFRQLVRRLGYRIVGDNVQSMKDRGPKLSADEKAARKKPSRRDFTEVLLDEVIERHEAEAPAPLPSWVVWTPGAPNEPRSPQTPQVVKTSTVVPSRAIGVPQLQQVRHFQPKQIVATSTSPIASAWGAALGCTPMASSMRADVRSLMKGMARRL